MPPKPKCSREDIVNAAYDIMCDNGVDAISAREVGKKLGTSFWILPSSINELIIVPEIDSISVEYLKEMVYIHFCNSYVYRCKYKFL